MPSQEMHSPGSLRSRYVGLLVWTFAACAIAGLYGTLHNQVSYTVSPDYFHAFKFDQFRFPEPWRHRGGASVIGFLASWWTGLAMGPLLFMTAWRCWKRSPTPREMLRGFGLILGIAVALGAAGLLYGSATFLPQPEFWVPHETRDRAAFHRAGMLHDASYLGAVVGTVVACLSIWRGSRLMGNPQPPSV